MSPEIRFQLALLAFELSGAVLALALNRYFDRLDLLTPIQSAVIVTPLAVLIASATAMAVLAGRFTSSHSRRAGLNIAANLAGVVLALAVLEVGVRVFTQHAEGGSWFAGTLLLPRRWDDVKAENRELLARNPANVSYFIPDSILGWVPGSSRQDKSGRYSTSVEGLRSARTGLAYAERPGGRRVAIVGDSYTFGLEVPFEDTWGARLETLLGSSSVVLNFGVDGYGVDQAYLRFDRDAIPWKPTVAILSFVEHDLFRTLSVYSFITFPEWGFPFAKPRFVLREGTLVRLNGEVESPEQILQRQSVEELPFITHDYGYRAAEWAPRPYEFSFLLRYLLSRFQRSPRSPVALSPEIETVNAALIRRFVERARKEGVEPVIVYLPSRGDFTGQDRSTKARVLESVERHGIGYADLTSCIGRLGVERAFVPGDPHYSADGNVAVARCLQPVVQARLGEH